MNKYSRRKFLKSIGATAAGAVLTITGCTPAKTPTPLASTATSLPPLPSATPPPAPSPTASAVAATATTLPTSAGANALGKPYTRPSIIKFFPEVKSRVVRSSDASVWDGDALVPEVLQGMVDRAITGLTGLKDPKEAWQALFKPDERIAIKVNAFRNSLIWTHPALVLAVTNGLEQAGIPAANITIFDFTTNELKTAGYNINRDGAGVRCYGSDKDYATSMVLQKGSIKTNVKLSDVLTNCDALINMPVLKSHMMSGMTFALKNHYGSVSYPDGLHDIRASLPALNALAPIKQTTRLVVGDILEANLVFGYAWPYWKADYRGDSILMSYDPLAHDTVGLQTLLQLIEAKGNSTDAIKGMALPWVQVAGDAGLGAADMKDIDLVEV